MPPGQFITLHERQCVDQSIGDGERGTRGAPSSIPESEVSLNEDIWGGWGRFIVRFSRLATTRVVHLPGRGDHASPWSRGASCRSKYRVAHALLHARVRFLDFLAGF